MNNTQKAQHVVDGHSAAVAFVDALRTSSPTGDELADILKTHSHPLAESNRLFLLGFVRQIQKVLEAQSAAQ